MRRSPSIWLTLSVAALALSSWVSTGASFEAPIVLTNSFEASPGQFGTILTSQTIGGQAPGPEVPLTDLPEWFPGAVHLGESNQWRFYVITNESGFTNAAFVLFDSQQVMRPAPFTNASSASDLDLYVSTDSMLLDLYPGSLASAQKSFGSGGDEVVVDTNAMAVTYYIAVKNEATDAQFGLAALFSELPFAETDNNGTILLHPIPAPKVIPSGTESSPGQALVFAIPPGEIDLRRVSVSTTIAGSADDLQISVHHAGTALLLHDFSTGGMGTNQTLTFDDSGEGDLPGSMTSAGPGSLREFAGQKTRAPWLLRFDNRSSAATLQEASVTLHPQLPTDSGITAVVLAGACHDEFVWIPPGTTSLTAVAALNSGVGPLEVNLAPADQPNSGFNMMSLTTGESDGVLQVTPWSNPPVSPGLWKATLRNNGIEPVNLTLSIFTQGQFLENQISRVRLGSPEPIADAAVSSYWLMVTNSGYVDSVQAGLRLDHPRLSDLEISLISPQGTRALLDFHRGGLTTNGIGHDIIVTNVFPVSSSGGPLGNTNRIDLTKKAGVISVTYDFYALPDSMRIYYETNLIFDSGLIADSGTTNVAYGPGEATFLTVVMNEGDNPDPDTAWFYTVTSVAPDFAFLTLADGSLPIKFAPAPFDFSPDGDYLGFLRGPEQPLSAFAGEPVTGAWRLEVRDTAPGPDDSSGSLVECELSFILRTRTPLPVSVVDAAMQNGDLAPGQVQWFKVRTLPWTASATNTLTSSAALEVVFSPTAGSWLAPEALTNTILMANCTACASVLTPGGDPALAPGAFYYLGLVNTNTESAAYNLRVELAPTVVALVNGTSVSPTCTGPGQNDYYQFSISDRARRAQFQLSDLTGDMVLFLKKDLPLPTPANAQAVSDNPGTSDEVIALRQDMGSVLLSPGAWYLCASNASGAAVSYTVTAHYWASTGIPILITTQADIGGELCFTWSTLPGLTYHIEATPDFQAPWSPVTPAITAENDFTSYCFPITEPAQFFRVHEGPP